MLKKKVNNSYLTKQLSDWIIEMFPDAKRTNHPIYSWIVIGPFFNEISNLKEESIFGLNSSFEFFEKKNGKYRFKKSRSS